MTKVKEKRIEKRDKSEVMTLRVTPKERDVIERFAEKEGMTPSQYMRTAVLMDMVLSGDLDAIHICAIDFRKGVIEVLKSKLDVLIEVSELKTA